MALRELSGGLPERHDGGGPRVVIGLGRGGVGGGRERDFDGGVVGTEQKTRLVGELDGDGSADGQGHLGDSSAHLNA